MFKLKVPGYKRVRKVKSRELLKTNDDLNIYVESGVVETVLDINLLGVGNSKFFGGQPSAPKGGVL